MTEQTRSAACCRGGVSGRPRFSPARFGGQLGTAYYLSLFTTRMPPAARPMLARRLQAQKRGGESRDANLQEHYDICPASSLRVNAERARQRMPGPLAQWSSARLLAQLKTRKTGGGNERCPPPFIVWPLPSLHPSPLALMGDRTDH